jgi:hypothetical protein
MPQRRQVLASVVIAALLLTTFAQVVGAHPGHRMRLRAFDNIWIDLRNVGSFTAAAGDRDLIIGLRGDDSLSAGDLHDHVLGGPGNDSIDGGTGPDRLVGGPGDDAIIGELVASPVGEAQEVPGTQERPGASHDIIHGGRGADDVSGGLGPDHVRGGPQDDALDGGDGRDWIRGGHGSDELTGGPGLDFLAGGPGDDTILAADDGPDWLRCGPGMDSYTADARDRVARSCETLIQSTGG